MIDEAQENSAVVSTAFVYLPRVQRVNELAVAKSFDLRCHELVEMPVVFFFFRARDDCD